MADFRSRCPRHCDWPLNLSQWLFCPLLTLRCRLAQSILTFWLCEELFWRGVREGLCQSRALQRLRCLFSAFETSLEILRLPFCRLWSFIEVIAPYGRCLLKSG